MRGQTHFLVIGLMVLFNTSYRASCAAPPVHIGGANRLEYGVSESGDRVPDFSSCGYAGGAESPPSVEVKVVIAAQSGDATERIQAALDEVAQLPINSHGFRGAVYLATGEHHVAGQLRISESGVVLRGTGATDGGTTVVATGQGRRPLIRVCPRQDPVPHFGEPATIKQDYVPVGATELVLTDASRFQAGDRVLVTRPSSEEWIELLNAKVLGVGWRAGRCDVRWERTVESVDGNAITLDAPLTCAMDQKVATMGTVCQFDAGLRLENVGIEDLQLRSEFKEGNPNDEEHSWHGVVMNHARNGWLRRLRFEHFAGGAVLLLEDCTCVTVADCLSLEPISELGGYRRHSFFTQGGQTLFLRCWAEHGQHDFAVGHCAPGPNAFVHCYAYDTNGDSGPLESWATGVLYDNVRIDGGNLFLGNRWLDPLGAGWSAANCLAWQCQAAQIHCFDPPGAANWVVGFWAQPVGDGEFHGESDFVRPTSLFQQQVMQHHGAEAAQRVGPLLLDPIASTSPTHEEAQEFVSQSNQPARTLRDLIEERMRDAEPPSVPRSAKQHAAAHNETSELARDVHPVEIVNGWLTVDGQVLTGGTLSPTWWRGTIRPDDAPWFGPSITRFAPGRYGVGVTDELPQVLAEMDEQGQVAYDHHYGLWYDRRRDDHLMVRRATGAVVPPFFEQPFARTGQGTAWDGLSRYDLTQYNPWYWSRLAEMANLCDQRQKVLLHQCYFQHNILEAGAHWADCPWRPANNSNNTGLTEPPPYIGDKRIFIAHQFYDPANAPLRALHRAYLQQCVAALKESRNVIHMTSAEYTGPLEFTQFWLDTMDEQRRELATQCLLAISATKDVQDSMLDDASRAAKIDVIDIRYWCYTRDGGVYAPPGGANMAPRQHQRQIETEGGDFSSVARAVREYRLRFPKKPLIFSANRHCPTPNSGWAVLMAGGSLADVPPLPVKLKRSLVHMRPTDEHGPLLRLHSDSGEQLCFAELPNAQLALPPSETGRLYRACWIDASTGKVVEESEYRSGEPVAMRTPVVWLKPID